VYPLAVAYKHSQDEKYATAAIKLGNWLITVQEASGAWIEEWPAASGWDGTTADQLISLANAYVILKSKLTTQEDSAWVGSITRSADWVAANFPKGNVNYVPTGAVGLLAANRAISSGKASWLTKAASLMTQTVAAINDEDLLTGEGMGVDLGYNIAQSIGYIAMYGLMLPAPEYVTAAADLLKVHQYFMYPGGAIDNSWGTRNFKWTLESGTKTAPGVFFSFALLADKDLRSCAAHSWPCHGSTATVAMTPVGSCTDRTLRVTRAAARRATTAPSRARRASPRPSSTGRPRPCSARCPPIRRTGSSTCPA
jgi:hypothetical protein